MKTEKGRELARRRTEMMRGFLGEVEMEWKDVEEGWSKRNEDE